MSGPWVVRTRSVSIIEHAETREVLAIYINETEHAAAHCARMNENATRAATRREPQGA